MENLQTILSNIGQHIGSMLATLVFWQRLSLVLAALAVIVLLSSEILYSSSSRMSMLVDKKRLRITGIGVTVAFLATAAIQIYLMQP